MAATGAADGFFRCVYEGCISGGDTEIQRRPYHRNCGCALHSKSNKKGKGKYSYTCPNGLPKCKNVSYPMRRSWSEGSLVMAASNYSSPFTSSLLDPGGYPAALPSKPPRHHHRHQSCINEEDLKV